MVLLLKEIPPSHSHSPISSIFAFMGARKAPAPSPWIAKHKSWLKKHLKRPRGRGKDDLVVMAAETSTTSLRPVLRRMKRHIQCDDHSHDDVSDTISLGSIWASGSEAEDGTAPGASVPPPMESADSSNGDSGGGRPSFASLMVPAVGTMGASEKEACSQEALL